MYHTEIINFYYLKKKKDITVKIEITTWNVRTTDLWGVTSNRRDASTKKLDLDSDHWCKWPKTFIKIWLKNTNQDVNASLEEYHEIMQEEYCDVPTMPQNDFLLKQVETSP